MCPGEHTFMKVLTLQPLPSCCMVYFFTVKERQFSGYLRLGFGFILSFHLFILTRLVRLWDKVVVYRFYPPECLPRCFFLSCIVPILYFTGTAVPLLLSFLSCIAYIVYTVYFVYVVYTFCILCIHCVYCVFQRNVCSAAFLHCATMLPPIDGRPFVPLPYCHRHHHPCHIAIAIIILTMLIMLLKRRRSQLCNLF